MRPEPLRVVPGLLGRNAAVLAAEDGGEGKSRRVVWSLVAPAAKDRRTNLTQMDIKVSTHLWILYKAARLCDSLVAKRSRG